MRKFAGLFLRILAVAADIIAVISIMSFNGTVINQNPTKFFLSPVFALAIWLISAFTYLGILQRYWQGQQPNKQFQTTFPLFIKQDLLQNFREPFLLLPALVLIILVFWIFAELIRSTQWLQVVLGYILVFGVIFGIPLVLARRIVRTIHEDDPEEKAKKIIDNDWVKLENVIETKLARKSWITVNDLADQAGILDTYPIYLMYALQKYSTEHPEQTAFGIVLRKDSLELVTKLPVLISLQNFPLDEFYHTG